MAIRSSCQGSRLREAHVPQMVSRKAKMENFVPHTYPICTGYKILYITSPFLVLPYLDTTLWCFCQFRVLKQPGLRSWANPGSHSSYPWHQDFSPAKARCCTRSRLPLGLRRVHIQATLSATSSHVWPMSVRVIPRIVSLVYDWEGESPRHENTLLTWRLRTIYRTRTVALWWSTICKIVYVVVSTFLVLVRVSGVWKKHLWRQWEEDSARDGVGRSHCKIRIPAPYCW